ncbi:serine/threonine protein kinase [Clostridium sp.]|jgi:RIO-like serine/threonine protein kinase|uniref:serine/threonine protein kinase n=1 Tax=Clostridium sp. TaxID=1506 RepID=UPI00258F5AB8|nr:serine/threonine protein kinase [Clostridium sp.]MDF2506136.1 hypothetical protein [Clostridium sp.]
MRKKRNSQKDNKKTLIIKLDECTYIGGSYNSSVYLMKDNRVVKIYKDPLDCKKQYGLLKTTSNSSFFPKIYNFCGHYIIREYINGISITKYIHENKFNTTFALTCIKFLEKLEINNILRLDISFKDIFVKNDGNLILIDITSSDLKDNTLCKILGSLKNFNVLNKFLYELKNYNRNLYDRWTKLL